jgi:hypothetical protein
MAQQPQGSSQFVFGPAGNGGGDILHFTAANANPSAGANFLGWVDNNALTGGVSGITNALAAGTPAAVAAAAASTAVFSSVLNLPANGAYEGVPFTVKASGWVTLNGGTYTATIQPFIYASKTLGYTASVAAAVLSTAATSLTIAVAAAATLTNFPWEAEVVLFGNTSSGNVGGKIPAGAVTVGPVGSIAPVPLPAAPAAITNPPTGVTFNTATVPLQFLAGVGIIGAAVSASNATLQSFFLES